MGWQVVRHSLGLMARNWLALLRLLALPFLLAAILSQGVTLPAPDPGTRVVQPPSAPEADLRIDPAAPMTFEEIMAAQEAQDQARLRADRPQRLLGAAAAFLLWAGAVAWTAVGWHRFILREEPIPFLPAAPPRLMASYASRLVLLAGVLLGAFVAAVLPIGLLMQPLRDSPVALLGIFALPLAVTFWVLMRLGLILPALALRERLTLGDSCNATAPFAGALVRLALGFAGVIVLQAILLSYLPLGDPWWALLAFSRNLLLVAFALSLLTTLYGHLVEGRSLA